MSQSEPPRTTLSTSGTVTVRQRPTQLLMMMQLKAAESTIERGLAELKKMSDETSQLLRRLGANQIIAVDPIFAEQVTKDPIQQVQARTALAVRGRLKSKTADEGKRELVAVVAAIWEIGSMSPEAIMALQDRLRFETAEDGDPSEPKEELPAWASPEEQVQAMMERLHVPPPDTSKPEFVFLGRLSDEQWAKATNEAFARCRQKAERLAAAAGMRLGRLSSMSYHLVQSALRSDKMMRRQGFMAILDNCAYDLAEDEMPASDPRPMDFNVAVNASFHLE